ncbi:hypothetical protein OHC33_011043 [Knufia fluminis]|uniref:Uncharacterized protein n=1 Tax=Knufia fluminis TaxID=191047 RepID=A0AAN8EM50_9EURO|nr:hypothetical protein OHC33_011043 [Knufia fluminis]
MIDLTKEEVERIFAGWPPFYRKTFSSHEGHVLESPLTIFDHVRRPGWIVAIGLGRVQPSDVFVDNTRDKSHSLFGFAIRRVVRVLEVHFENEWRGNTELSEARASIETMMSHGQSAENVLGGSELADSDTVSYPKLKDISDLTKTQCEALMRVFNNMVISADDKAIIDPVLGICMHRVIIGVAVALKYSSAERILRIPPILRGDKVVYLRSCKHEED